MLVDWSEDREVFRLDEEFDAAGHAGLSCDEAGPLEGEEHLVDGGRRHPQVALQVGFGRLERDDQDERGATIWMRAWRRGRTAGRA